MLRHELRSRVRTPYCSRRLPPATSESSSDCFLVNVSYLRR